MSALGMAIGDTTGVDLRISRGDEIEIGPITGLARPFQRRHLRRMGENSLLRKAFAAIQKAILQEIGKERHRVGVHHPLVENDRLEKREISIGKDLWGSYYEIYGGVTAEDLIAFPYGKNVTEGAKTKQGTLFDLQTQ